MSGLDHGELNLPLSKRYGRGGIDAAIARHLAKERGEKAARAKEQRQAAAEAEAARVRLTHDEVKGARLIRDQFGWHKVVRVNAKSVTVETPHSWTDRITLDRVLEVRR